MATRSVIGILGPKNSAKDATFDPKRPVKEIYCHNGGELAENGVLLYVFYTTVADVYKLVEGGSISTLGYAYGKKHDGNKRMYDEKYRNKVRFMTLVYNRDCDRELIIHNTTVQNVQTEAYNYLFVPEERQWYYRERNKWYSLKEGLLEEITSVDKLLSTLMFSIDETDKEAMAKLDAFIIEFNKYRSTHSYRPSYYTLVEMNNGRIYWFEKKIGPAYNYHYIHIDKVKKTKDDIVLDVSFGQRKDTITLDYLLNSYNQDEGMIIKNPSKLSSYLK